MLKNIFKIILFIALTAVSANASDTSLLFVGEDVSMLTIASRRAESPQDAPAIARVINKDEIAAKGYKTLAEVLSDLPGFYISPMRSGSVPYMRGLPNSTLFLYDSVHLTSDAAKSISPLDQELSLAHVKQIEVIRGSGSVLWGPDAFGGIVNIVPKQGRDVDGIEITSFAGTPDKAIGSTLSWGKNAGIWEAFLSVSFESVYANESNYNINRLTDSSNSPLPIEERMVAGSINNSKYAEAVFNFSWQDWLRLSGRWSDAQKEYILEDDNTGLRWPAQNDKPMGYIRIELENKFSTSALRLNGYYSIMDETKQEIDFPPQDQSSKVSYGELLYDKELWEATGMLTLGTSFRYNQINGAEISKAYLPDFFETGNIAFFPRPQQTDFNTSMFDVFGQLKRHWQDFDIWCGIRLTNHSEYSVETRPNLGIIWSPSTNWNFKMLYGSSYRTPYARQLIGRDDLEPEEIENISASVMWRATPALRLTATGFLDQTENHTTQDPYYGGLSNPTSQDISGIEFEVDWQISQNLNFQTNATTFTHSGDDETYTYYAYVLEDGEWVLKPWASWDIPHETGPKSMMNAGVVWSPTAGIDFSLNAKYETAWDYFYDKGENKGTVSEQIMIDTSVVFSNIYRNLDLHFAVKNLTNNKNNTKGTYGPIDSPPFNAYMEFKWKLP